MPESGGEGIVDEVTSECFGRCASNPFLSTHPHTRCHLAAPCHKFAVNSPVGAQGSRAKRLESEEDARDRCPATRSLVAAGFDSPVGGTNRVSTVRKYITYDHRTPVVRVTRHRLQPISYILVSVGRESGAPGNI